MLRHFDEVFLKLWPNIANWTSTKTLLLLAQVAKERSEILNGTNSWIRHKDIHPRKQHDINSKQTRQKRKWKCIFWYQNNHFTVPPAQRMESILDPTISQRLFILSWNIISYKYTKLIGLKIQLQLIPDNCFSWYDELVPSTSI